MSVKAASTSDSPYGSVSVPPCLICTKSLGSRTCCLFFFRLFKTSEEKDSLMIFLTKGSLGIVKERILGPEGFQIYNSAIPNNSS